MMRHVVAAVIFVLVADGARCQEISGTAAVEDTVAAPWSFYASAYAYFVPDDRDILTPVFTADRAHLHLEARYNYEGFETGSVFVGMNFAGGDTLKFEFTPMLGWALGETNGAILGYRGALYYGRFDFSSEGEYLIDTEDKSDSFFYSWSEVAYSPRAWFRTGLVVQQTVDQTDVETESGIHAGVARAGVDAALSLFNFVRDDPIVMLLAGVAF